MVRARKKDTTPSNATSCPLTVGDVPPELMGSIRSQSLSSSFMCHLGDGGERCKLNVISLCSSLHCQGQLFWENLKGLSCITYNTKQKLCIWKYIALLWPLEKKIHCAFKNIQPNSLLTYPSLNDLCDGFYPFSHGFAFYFLQKAGKFF